MELISNNNYYYQFINFEHELASTRNPLNKSFDRYPPEYTFFFRNTKPQVHDFYRYWLIENIPIDKSKIHADLYDFLYQKVNSLNADLINKLRNTNFIKRLNLRRHTSYSHFSSHMPDDIISPSLLQTYTKAYENTEILLIWLDIVRKINNLNTISEKSYTDNSGNIKKGVLVDIISNKLKKHSNIKHIFDTAYPKKFRNLVDHNNIFIDDNHNLRIIEDESIFMYKNKFFESLYSIQTLHNLTVVFAVRKTININNMINQGYITAATLFTDNSPDLIPLQTPFNLNTNYPLALVTEIASYERIIDFYTSISSHLKFYYLSIDLFQLQPFFELDQEKNKKLNDFKIVFSRDKTEKIPFINIERKNNLIVKIKVTPIVLLWYISTIIKSINIYSCKPSYFLDEDFLIIPTQYGHLGVNFSSKYIVSQSKII